MSCLSVRVLNMTTRLAIHVDQVCGIAQKPSRKDFFLIDKFGRILYDINNKKLKVHE